MSVQEEIAELKAMLQAITSELAATKQELLLTKTELRAVKQELQEVKSENLALKEANRKFRAQLKQNSKNSHKPPSSDIKKPAIPRKKGGKRGGKDGHKGNTLKMVEKADHYETNRPEQCKRCGSSLAGLPGRKGDEVRQVYDIVLQPMQVTEYTYEVVTCNCGAVHCGSFPSYASQSVQYGPNVKALWTILNNECRLPYEKISQLTKDLFNQPVNVATVLNSTQQCFERLAETEAHIKSKVEQAELAHFDETGVRASTKNHWVHVASTKEWTYMFGHEKRGKAALDSAYSVLPNFKGRAVHDCWRSYFNYDCEHALCNAHLLRELTSAKEQGRKWAGQMHELLMTMYHASEKGTSTVPDYESWVKKFQAICALGDKEEPAPQKGKRGKPKRGKSRNLLERLLKYQDEVLAFAKYENVPFTNNLAERDIRNVKTKIKIATSFRTFNGLQVYSGIQGYISTLKKQQLHIFQNIKALFEGGKIVFVEGRAK